MEGREGKEKGRKEIKERKEESRCRVQHNRGGGKMGRAAQGDKRQ